LNRYGKVITLSSKEGSLYYLKCDKQKNQQFSVMQNERKERLWHCHYGHLGMQSLNRPAGRRLVNNCDCDVSKEIGFCETCLGGKHHRSHFQSSIIPCSKVNPQWCLQKNEYKIIGGAEYFLTFIDDTTHYMLVCLLKHKNKIFIIS